MNEMLNKAAEALKARGFDVIMAETAADAKKVLSDMIPAGASIGCGGSVTIRDLGICDMKKAEGSPIYWHWMPDGMSNREIFFKALDADFYLASANALTVGGEMVNIDATGNRLAAMAWGPKQLVLVVGKNKLVEGGIQQAIARVKKEACPKNAIRLKRDTYCAQHGTCNVAACPNSMCRVIEVLDMPPHGHPVTVVLVNEDMGY